MDKNTTDFGFEEIPLAEKKSRVGRVFDSVADKYDLMNDLMSGGVHRLWKRYTIHASRVRPGQKVLDVAGGTGDMARAFQKKVGTTGQVILSDINAQMLERGRDRLLDQGLHLEYVLADAEKLPFPDNYFDCVCIAFGLRNVSRKEKALENFYRVLKPGGQLLILEFSKPTWPGLQKIYDAYSFHLLPKLGKWVANDAESYRYLVESIRKHPDQETLKQMVLHAGFEQCVYHNLTGGVVALHHAHKL